MTISHHPFRLRSFVRRCSRQTAAQIRAQVDLWPQFGLTLTTGLIDFTQTFHRNAPRYLEIGFGSGQTLLAAAQAYPHLDFIGVETHRPGIGSLLHGMSEKNITNIRIFDQDVIDVLEKAIPPHSLDGTQIFFPDPWPKRRHHIRRLIQPTFIDLLIGTLKPGADLYFATDWEDYAQQMLQVLTNEPRLVNQAGNMIYASRSPYRPIISKFEGRAIKEGRQIFEFHFQFIESPLKCAIDKRLV